MPVRGSCKCMDSKVCQTLLLQGMPPVGFAAILSVPCACGWHVGSLITTHLASYEAGRDWLKYQPLRMQPTTVAATGRTPCSRSAREPSKQLVFACCCSRATQSGVQYFKLLNAVVSSHLGHRSALPRRAEGLIYYIDCTTCCSWPQCHIRSSLVDFCGRASGGLVCCTTAALRRCSV